MIDLKYELLKNENSEHLIDLYFYDNSLKTWYFIKSYSKNTTIKEIQNYIKSLWDIKKYNILLKYNIFN